MNLSFIESADALGTSQEIMDAIWSLAGEEESEAFRIWDTPTERELLTIREIVTKNSSLYSHELCWDDCFDWWPYEG